MWLSWLSLVPQSERSLVQFPVRAHAYIAELRGNWSMFLSLSFSLPFPLSKN